MATRISAKFKGLSIFLTVEEHEQLLRRFSPDQYDLYDGSPEGGDFLVAPGNMPPKNFDIDEYDPEYLYYQTQIPCPLCEKYAWPNNPSCKGCTFNKFSWDMAGEKFGKNAGCINIINILLREAGFPDEQLGYLEFGNGYVNFDYVTKEICFKQLKAIYNWIGGNNGRTTNRR